MQTTATSRVGFNLTRLVVERANSIFQEIDQSNDIGNDAYIEFIVGESFTGCCITAQIKSGPSYVAADGSLVLVADRDHFEYWQSHVLPVAGIVVDPASQRIGWCDITAHLRNAPAAIAEGPYRIVIPEGQLLSDASLDAFREHFMSYQRQFSDDGHFGRALERFAPVQDPPTRIEAMRSLFSYHRNRPATWCYVASLLKSIQDIHVLRVAVSALSHLPGHGDIFWHRRNELDPAARLGGLTFIQLTFGRDDVIQLLRVVDDHGFDRGTIGQAAHAVVGAVRQAPELLRSIAFDPTLSQEVRAAAILLYVFYTQETSVETCIEVVTDFRAAFSGDASDAALAELLHVLRSHGRVAFY